MMCGFCCHLEASEIQEVLAAIPWDSFLEMYRFFFPLAAQVGSRNSLSPIARAEGRMLPHLLGTGKVEFAIIFIKI